MDYLGCLWYNKLINGDIMFKKFKKIMVLFLVLFSFLMPINIKGDSFDYSRNDSLDTVVMSASEFIEYISDSKLCSAEKEYLKDLVDTFKYENKIPYNSVNTSLNEDVLSIHASVYSYTDINNNIISWIPYKARVNDKTAYFEDQGEFYDCLIKNVLENEEEATIYYKTNIYLDYNKVNVIINDAYNLASYYVENDIINKENEKYNNLYQEYLKELDDYNNYLNALDKYKSDLNNYNNYLKELNNYNELYEDYLEYVDEYNNYQKELEDYNKYLVALENYPKELEKYQNYLIEKEKYDALYATYVEEYKVYEFEIAYVNYGLKVMDIIKSPRTSLERSIYNDVMGNAVTQVLDKRDILYSVGVDKQLIMGAEKATYALREIFTDYYSLNSDEEKWIYYSSNFTTIKNNIKELLYSLEGLYQDPMVKSGISSFDKEEQYLILISQLVYVNILMNGTNIKTTRGTYFNDSWRIEGRTKEDVLENSIDFYLDNKLRTPIIKHYPVEPIPPTITEVKEPVYPKEVSKPVEPVKVNEPSKPLSVAKPVEPEIVLEPSEPIPYKCDEVILDLIDAYNKGELIYREEYIEDICVELNSTFTKKFKNSSLVTVEFYDLNKNFLNAYTTESGSYITYDISLPVKEGDEIYSSYKFSHWEYEDKTILDLNNVTREGFVYPVFVGDVYKEYLITWEVDGDISTEFYHYGDLVSYKGKLEKDYQTNVFYVFDKWDSELESVSSDKSYVALFKECYLIEEDEKYAKIDYSDSLISIDIRGFNSNALNLNNFIKYVINDDNTKKIRIISDEYEITFSSANFNKLCDLSLEKIIINVLDLDNFEYSYYVEFIDSDLNVINENVEFSSKFFGSFDLVKSVVNMEDANGNFTEIRANIKNNEISFNSMNNNAKYNVYPLFGITIISNDCISIVSDKNKAKIGELVDVDVELLVNGIYLESLIIMDSSGNKIDFNDEYIFNMPNKDLFIMASYQFYNYTVKFVSNGEVISSKVYKYGDTVQVPSNPYKAADEFYTYKFKSWDKEVSLVTNDEVYTAVFESFEKEILEEPSRAPLYILVSCVSFILASAFFLIIIKKKKLLFFKKKENKKKENKKNKIDKIILKNESIDNMEVEVIEKKEEVIEEKEEFETSEEMVTDDFNSIEKNIIISDRKFKYKRKKFKR